MTQPTPQFPSAVALPEPLRSEVVAELKRLEHGDPDEAVLAWMAIDLDKTLHFTQGALVVTERRILARSGGDASWQQWRIAPGLTLHHSDHAGVGTLELQDGQRRLDAWHYTLGHNPDALRLIDQFHAQRDRIASGGASMADADDAGVCPTCRAPLPPGEDECPQCSRELETPPSTWALLRLWRFARPYRMQLLAGFVLTLLSTGATLVPPYLTMPLMDKVLIPFQNGVPIDYGLVRLYLGGLLGAALVAWSLGWARTYLLARVSERIGSDLRTTTYEHLLKLSLQYFGGKRTGDLMARIGNESDRICVFLSLHLLDFATDVLMIMMTAIILISINPWLALVTLVPLPFIAWMIHQVRDRLRHGFEKIDRNWSEITNVLADTIPGIRVVKAFAQERREVERFREANRHNLAINDRVNAVWSLFTPTVTLLTEVGLLVVWIFGIWQVSRDAITVGVLVAFLTYISRFYTRLDSMSRIVSVTQKAAAGAKRIFDILDHVSSVPEPARPVHLERVTGAIELRDVGFRYGRAGKPALRDVSLTVKAGEVVALVGPSGSSPSAAGP
ncbi:ATP-binding cassette subfamily B protein [Cupriavidus gilardii J11]|uniref:ATP-binding cassette subfamily B protein n=1 Tax=Cupriavidus gilardii J11 TaxID=936133 RepID=A0A562BBW6_9BURK|nr:ATP-binding cassette subfamily B protein [Cupriavidus gilardii J11]